MITRNRDLFRNGKIVLRSIFKVNKIHGLFRFADRFSDFGTVFQQGIDFFVCCV